MGVDMRALTAIGLPPTTVLCYRHARFHQPPQRPEDIDGHATNAGRGAFWCYCRRIKFVSDTIFIATQILHPRTTPIDPRDGAEHPTREAVKRFLGIKPIGLAFNPAATSLPPQLPPNFYGSEGRERFPLR